jgi:hypothetical protein
MTTSPEELLARLDDIRGLGHIGWWPLAPGWWGLLALVSLLAGAMYLRRRAYWRSWKGDARKALDLLDAQLNSGNRQETAARLSALLRRIAMQRHSRAECAGLWGQDWLRWLTAKDPRGFNWVALGTLLVEAPYAPPGRNCRLKDLKSLISAAKRWVK